MSAFSRLAAASRAAVEAVHGETVTVTPMDTAGGPNARPAASATRPAFTTIACFHSDSQPRTEVRPSSMGVVSALRSTPLTASIRLDGRSVRTGDRMARGGAHYEITAINPDGLDGALLTLAIAATPGVAP